MSEYERKGELLRAHKEEWKRYETPTMFSTALCPHVFIVIPFAESNED